MWVPYVQDVKLILCILHPYRKGVSIGGVGIHPHHRTHGILRPWVIGLKADENKVPSLLFCFWHFWPRYVQKSYHLKTEGQIVGSWSRTCPGGSNALIFFSCIRKELLLTQFSTMHMYVSIILNCCFYIKIVFRGLVNEFKSSDWVCQVLCLKLFIVIKVHKKFHNTYFQLQIIFYY